MIIMLFVVIIFTACKKETGVTTPDTPGGENQAPGTALITAAGEPSGDAVTAHIGATGGSITTGNGVVRIEIPAGALEATTEISIQPVTNTNTAGWGAAWRITPHLVFKKPVQISFGYEASQINTIPEAIGVAFQDENGAWQGMGGLLDSVQQTITVSATHFSDWSVFKAFEFIPASAVVNPGKSIPLTIANNMMEDDLDVPEIGKVKPLSKPRDAISSLIREWKLNGAGQLKASGKRAEYTAPAGIPAKNPVAVSVMLKGKGAKQYQLVCNIYIGMEGINFRVNNGNWMHASVATGAMASEGNLLIEGGVVVNGKPEGAVGLIIKDKYKLGFLPWGEQFPFFVYSTGNNIVYRHFMPKPGAIEVSPGGIDFMTFTTKPGNYITGTFYLEKAGKQEIINNTATYTPVRIDGFFRVKRNN